MRLMNPFFNKPSKLLDRERGKRVFILANGPSIVGLDLSFLKDEIVIGMNASSMLEECFGFRSKYYVLSDKRFINTKEKRAWATEKLWPQTHRIVRADIRPYDDPELETRTTYIAPLARDGFSKNLSVGYFYGCTTTMLALQVAWHLGSREVYILGCDLRYPNERPRFYSEETPQLEDAFTSIQIWNIVNAAMIFEKHNGKLASCSADSFLRPYLDFAPLSSFFD